jgi:hypothetical protein
LAAGSTEAWETKADRRHYRRCHNAGLFAKPALIIINSLHRNVPAGLLQCERRCTGACTLTFSGFGGFNDGDGAETGIIRDWAATFTTLHGDHILHYGGDFRRIALTYISRHLSYTNGMLDNAAAAPIGGDTPQFCWVLRQGG